MTADDLDAANAGWAERAARKGAHSEDEAQRRAEAAIVSPIEGGGGASC